MCLIARVASLGTLARLPNFMTVFRMWGTKGFVYVQLASRSIRHQFIALCPTCVSLSDCEVYLLPWKDNRTQWQLHDRLQAVTREWTYGSSFNDTYYVSYALIQILSGALESTYPFTANPHLPESEQVLHLVFLHSDVQNRQPDNLHATKRPTHCSALGQQLGELKIRDLLLRLRFFPIFFFLLNHPFRLSFFLFKLTVFSFKLFYIRNFKITLFYLKFLYLKNADTQCTITQ